MGLDVSHGCFSGAYSAFNRYREELARIVGIPLPLMEGFYEDHLWRKQIDTIRTYADAHYPELHPSVRGAMPDGVPLYYFSLDVSRWLPLKWEAFRFDPLFFLLDHSDCDGWLPVECLLPLAQRLEELLPLLPGDETARGHIQSAGGWRAVTQRWIDGLRLAAERDERVEFH